MKTEERDRLLEESKRAKDKAIKECIVDIDNLTLHVCQIQRIGKDIGIHVMLHEGIVRLILEIPVNESKERTKEQESSARVGDKE